MASATISRPDVFPNETEVAAYPKGNWLTDDPPSGEPRGAATEEATVAEDEAAFTELAADTDYYVAGEVGGVWRYLLASTGLGSTVTGARDEPEKALKSLLEVLERKGIITDGTTAS